MTTESPSPSGLDDPLSPASLRTWLARIGDWRSWAHFVVAGLIGAGAAAVLPGVILVSGFGGTGAFFLVSGVALFGLGALLGVVGAVWGRRRGGALIPAVGAVFVFCIVAGIYALTMRTPGLVSGDEVQVRSLVAAGLTAAGFALLSWPGPQRVIALVLLLVTLIVVPPWPGDRTSGALPEYTPPPSVEPLPEVPWPDVVPYGTSVDGFAAPNDPASLYGQPAILWDFVDLDAQAVDDLPSFVMITEAGPVDACGDTLVGFQDSGAPVTQAELSCEPTSEWDLADAWIRTSEKGHELSAVIDGIRIRALATSEIPESMLAAALVSATPMPQDDYDAWVERRGPLYAS